MILHKFVVIKEKLGCINVDSNEGSCLYLCIYYLVLSLIILHKIFMKNRSFIDPIHFAHDKFWKFLRTNNEIDLACPK